MSKSSTNVDPTDKSEQHAQTTESGGSAQRDIDEATLYDPGMIKVSDPGHRRLLEEVGKADKWRVVFIGAAAEAGPQANSGESDE